MTLKLHMRRWRCCSNMCERQTFVERLPEIAAPLARRRRRAAELLHLFGHSVGGRPGERLMERLGMPTSDDTILRHLKRQAKARGAKAGARVVGIDDWAWRKGSTYGTIVVDLERREVIDVLPDRPMAGTANWLELHPDVEIVSRDRCGLFAQGAREGAPQARQVADRFHILQNLRDAIQAQLSRATGASVRPLLPGTAIRGFGARMVAGAQFGLWGAVHATRPNSAWPNSRMLLSVLTAIAASVLRRSSARDFSASPITRL